MNVDASKVIDKLAERISLLVKELAVKDAIIEDLQQSKDSGQTTMTPAP